MKDTVILGIESSCDETAASVVVMAEGIIKCYCISGGPACRIWRSGA